ncbi:MAG TPA: hypothetical protein VHT21_00100 [Stellaceae bacterium]|nr:hypothetical protein [Stellaceae bacterium]
MREREGEGTERTQAREEGAEQEESLDERRGEEDQRDFKSAKEADSKGRKTERWRPGGGEEKPKEDQNAREERGRGDWGRAERRRERARDCGVERKETGTCTSTIDFSSDNLTFTSRSFPSLRISETFTSEEREEEMQDAQEEDEEDEQEGEEG